MNINDVFPSNYIKASDLQGQARLLTISAIALEQLGTGESKPVLQFAGHDKGLVLNKTNASILAASFSPETDGWIGKQIELYPDKVSFQGRIVDAVRVRVPVPAAAAPAQPATAQPAPAGVPPVDPNDELPADW